MASSRTIQRDGRAGWALVTAIHDVLRCDLDQLLRSTAGHTPARARWIMFAGQLRFHFAAEHAAMWSPTRAKLAGDPPGQALRAAMEDEQQLIGPLLAVTDDAITMNTDPVRLRQLLTRLWARLTSHLAHQEADALPPIGQILSPGELGAIARAIGGRHRGGHAARTIPWAIAGTGPNIRTQALGQLAAPTRLLCRTIWLPRVFNWREGA